MILFSFVWWKPIRHVLIINEMTSLIIKKGRPTEFTSFCRRCVPFVIRFECLLIQRTVNNIKGNSLRLHRPLLIRDSCRVPLSFSFLFFCPFLFSLGFRRGLFELKSRGSRPIEKRCMHTQQKAQATRSAREWCWIYIYNLPPDVACVYRYIYLLCSYRLFFLNESVSRYFNYKVST